MSEIVEEWRPVPGYESVYEVSNLGRVRSLPRTSIRRYQNGRQTTCKYPGVVMQPNQDGKILLTADGQPVCVSIAALVLAAFSVSLSTSDILHNNYKGSDHRKRGLPVRLVELSMTFSSCAEAARYVDVHKATVHVALHSGRTFKTEKYGPLHVEYV